MPHLKGQQTTPNKADIVMAGSSPYQAKNADTLPNLGSLIVSVSFSFPTYPSELITIIPKYESGLQDSEAVALNNDFIKVDNMLNLKYQSRNTNVRKFFHHIISS